MTSAAALAAINGLETEAEKAAYRSGHEAGFEEGHKEGYDEGRRDGHSDGYSEGRAEGEGARPIVLDAANAMEQARLFLADWDSGIVAWDDGSRMRARGIIRMIDETIRACHE